MPRIVTTIDELNRLAERAEPSVRRAIRDATARLQRQMTAAQLASGRIPADLLRRSLASLQVAFAALLERTMRLSYDALVQGISFRLVNPDAVLAALSRQHGARLVKAVGEDVKAGLRRTTARSVRLGTPARTTAKIMRQQVGLGPWQVRSLQRQQAELIRQGYSGDRLATAMARRSKKALVYRTETIARTETIRAANLGQQAIWEKMERLRNTGPGTKADYRRRWFVSPDSRLCPICRSLNGQVRKLGEPFVSPRTGKAYKMPPAHPRCRCGMGLVLSTPRVA